MKRIIKCRRILSVKWNISLIALFFSAGIFLAATPGQRLDNIQVQNPQGLPSLIPFFGEKVIAIFYNDPDTADIGDPLADAIKAKGYPADKYVGIGIANCKDAPFKPDSVIRWVLRRKSEKYKSTMMADSNHAIKNGWGLGNCDDTCVVLVIGRDKQLKHVVSVKNQEQSRGAIAAVISVLDREVIK